MSLTAAARAEELRASDAPSAPASDSAQAAAFADALSAEGDYYRAIGEYKRALFLAPDAAEAGAWRLAIGEAYRLGEQYDEAARHFERIGLEAKGDERALALLGAAKAHLAAGHFESAVARSRDAAGAFTDPARVREARYVEGWSLLRAERDAEAAKAFELARGEGVPGEGADKLVKVMPQLERLPSKSPLAAGLLGLIPGMGHLYLGEPSIAMSALAWNGVFGWALYQAVQDEAWSLAVVLGMFEAMWYGGSIVGAISGAHRYNRDARLNAMEDMARISPPFATDELVEKRQ